MEWLTHTQTSFQQAARYLLGMRLAIVVIQLVAVVAVGTMATLEYQTEALLASLLYGVLATLGWLWFTLRPPRFTLTVSFGFALDLLLIGGWLYLTGGYTNPLVSLLLLPIAVAIILVPLRESIALTIAGIGVYTALVVWHSPIGSGHHGSNLAQLHLMGMWASFAITAMILILVVGALARRLRQKQAQLAEFRENRLRNEQIITLGLSAASVAHRLGTPLNTVSLLVEEMKATYEDSDLEADLSLLNDQLDFCINHLRQLSSAATQARESRLELISLHAWMKRLQESTTLLWPAAPIEWQEPFPDDVVAVDATLDQAILNLLDNALGASPRWVAVSAVQPKSGGIDIVVEDCGEGLDVSLQERAGEAMVKSEQGLGVGLFLSNATIQRLGGTLKARSDERGTIMIVHLPQANSIDSGNQPTE